MKSRLALLLSLSFLSYDVMARLPSSYTELLDYVQIAPDQGESNTCLYVGSTGAMELIANKKAGIKHPVPYGPYDLSEAFLIYAPAPQNTGPKNFLEKPVLRFNRSGYGIHLSQWDFTTWNGNESRSPWIRRDWSKMEKTPLPKIETLPLFLEGRNRWSTRVLKEAHIQKIKEALWTHKSPVLVNYNDDNYWHVVVIVGYDDELPGNCYAQDIRPSECNEMGSFFVRDSFGIPVEVRSYDWFRIKGNTAVVVKEVDP